MLHLVCIVMTYEWLSAQVVDEHLLLINVWIKKNDNNKK